MCICPDRKVGRQLILHRGLHPVVLDEPDSPSTQADAVQLAKGAGFCKAGDTVIVAYRDHVSPAKDLALKILVVRERPGSMKQHLGRLFFDRLNVERRLHALVIAFVW